jgi:hypothetical protein
MKIEEIPPGQLPPIPDECMGLSESHTNALFGAYTTGQVSQLQITRAANTFYECLKDAGLSNSEAKGIIKNKENTLKVELEKGQKGNQGFFPF